MTVIELDAIALVVMELPLGVVQLSRSIHVKLVIVVGNGIQEMMGSGTLAKCVVLVAALVN